MTLNEACAYLDALEKDLSGCNHAICILSYDGDTVAPKNSAEGRGRTMAWLSGIYHSKMTDPRTVEALQTVIAHRDETDRKTFRRAEVLKRSCDDLVLTPADEYAAYAELLARSGAVWHEAKLKSDWDAFAPYLEKIVAYNIRNAQRKDAAKPVYDVLLDTYEQGTGMKQLDPFFATLRSELTPVIHAVSAKPAPDVSFLQGCFPVERQRVFSDRIMQVMGIDRDDCSIGETEHPFTTNANKHDVRITTHYHEEDLTQSMFSVIHEGGHALYELGSGDELEGTVLSGGVSMSIHESQSRFYENVIGRSRAFCDVLLPILQELFPEQMKAVDAGRLYRAINKSQPSLIRTEADELTYPMHIMIRYELEKGMFSGALKIADVPGEWNRMYKEYLGVTVPDHCRGVLQDVHWGSGLLGYFPSYALGSAYDIQLLEAMQKDFDVWAAVSAGQLNKVTEWLREKIHRHGAMMTPAETLRQAIGTEFDPAHYTAYLAKKYGELYGL